eukprot:8312001-Ditylum_brightwellii.AAC.1
MIALLPGKQSLRQQRLLTMERNGSGARSTNVKECTMAFICPRPMTMQNGKRIAIRSGRR